MQFEVLCPVGSARAGSGCAPIKCDVGFQLKGNACVRNVVAEEVRVSLGCESCGPLEREFSLSISHGDCVLILSQITLNSRADATGATIRSISATGSCPEGFLRDGNSCRSACRAGDPSFLGLGGVGLVLDCVANDIKKWESL